MIRSAAFLAGAMALVLSAVGAQAQQAGTYVGTSNDGGSISVVVTGSSPNFTLSNMNVNFQADCTHPARTANEGWGFFLGQAIVNGDNNFHSGNDYYDIRGALHFVSNNKIKGTITSVTALFTPGHNPPIKSQFCKSATQGFTLLFQSPAKKDQRRGNDAVVLEKRIGH